MPLEFHKLHGAGNDFVLIDARGRDLPLDARRAARIADRHRGIGCDQILVLRESGLEDCSLRYEIWNADGSPAAQCGNGARCVGLFLHLHDGPAGGSLRVESPAGPVDLRRCDDGEFEVAMGVPDFDPDAIPIKLAARNGWYELESPWGPLRFGAVSMGNPHALVPVDDIEDEVIPAIGEFIGRHEIFPNGCNVGFALIESRERLRLRVVERGAGETMACGSGACAAMAILRRSNRIGDAVEVALPGGRLVVKWPGDKRPLTLKGPAAYVFKGTMNE